MQINETNYMGHSHQWIAKILDWANTYGIEGILETCTLKSNAVDEQALLSFQSLCATQKEIEWMPELIGYLTNFEYLDL